MIDVPRGARAAGYVRLSVEDDTSTSSQRQRGDLERLADANGWQLDVYEDLDISAYSGATRPGFEQMLSRLDGYDVLICWKLDRLVRRTRDLPRVTDLCDAHDVALVSATEGGLGGGPGGQFILGVFAGLAELESATISMRIKSSQQHLAAQGRYAGGFRPYGYRPVPNPHGPGKILKVDADEQAIVIEIARRILAGESSRSIAWNLNERDLTTSRGNAWNSRSLARMMRSPVMTGHTMWSGKVVAGDDGLPVQHREPLLDPFTWRRVVTELDARSTGPRRRADSTLLGGLLKCGRCGTTMTGWATDHPNATYKCDARTQYGPDTCAGNAVNRMLLDELAGALITSTVTAAQIAQAHARLAAEQRPDPNVRRIAALEDALAKLERDRQVLGLYDDDEDRYVSRWREYTGELRRLRADRPRPSRASLIDVAPAEGVTQAWWDATDRSTRRQVVLASLRSITIAPRDAGKKRWDPTRVVDVRWQWDPQD